MTDETKAEPGQETEDAAATIHMPFPASAFGGLMGNVINAGGVGELMHRAFGIAEDQIKPTVEFVTDPSDDRLTVPVIVSKDGVDVIPANEFDGYRTNPKRRTGTAHMTRIDSFIDHINRFGDDDSAVFANDDRKNPSLTAVLDYNRKDATIGEDRGHGEYRFGEHQTTFAFPLSNEWKAWTGSNGKWFAMSDFSQFLEENMGDIDVPDGGRVGDKLERFVEQNGGPSMIADYSTLVTLSRGLKVFAESTVEEAINLANGEGHLRFGMENVSTRNAMGNEIKVPTMFMLAIPVFHKGQYYRIGAALRFRKVPGEGVKFAYKLYREDIAFDDAFGEAVDRVDAETSAQVFFGSAE